MALFITITTSGSLYIVVLHRLYILTCHSLSVGIPGTERADERAKFFTGVVGPEVGRSEIGSASYRIGGNA